MFRKNGSGLYLFVISGKIKIGEIELENRDGIGITETDSISILTSSDCEILLMEVPII